MLFCNIEIVGQQKKDLQVIQTVNVPIGNVFQESEKSFILAYQKRTIELLDTRIMKDSGRIHAHLSLEIGNPVNIQVELPAEEELRSFYMAFRFFYLKKEPSYFPRVANIVERFAKSDALSQYIDGLRQQWNDALSRQGWNISINEKPLTTSVLINLWFNAHYFHSDGDKEKQLLQLDSILGAEFNRYLLANAVFEASKAVHRLYYSIKTIKV